MFLMVNHKHVKFCGDMDSVRGDKNHEIKWTCDFRDRNSSREVTIL